MPFITQGKTNIRYILIIVILAIIVGGAISWQIFGNPFEEKPLSICGPDGPAYWIDVSNCNKSCMTDEDCVFTCGCGAINKNEICHHEGVKYKCIDRDVRCENNTCVAGEEKTTICDWRPNIAKYGQCEKMLGYYYDGEKCRSLSGCDLTGDKVPFLSMEECKNQCEKDETTKPEIGCVDSDAQCKGKPDGTECTTGIWCDESGEVCGGQSCVGLGFGRCSGDKCLPLTEEEFCGWSTNKSCISDSGCISGGCSGQVCQSKNEEGVITTCEYRDCYSAEKYGLSCKCANNKCQWIK